MILLSILISINFCLLTSDVNPPEVKFTFVESNNFQYLVYIDRSNERCDTLAGFGYKSIIQDYKIHIDGSITVITEEVKFGNIRYQTFIFDEDALRFSLEESFSIGRNTYSTRGALIGGESSPKFKILAKNEVVRIDKDRTHRDAIDLDKFRDWQLGINNAKK